MSADALRRYERLTWFFREFKTPYVIGTTNDRDSAVAQFKDRKALMRHVRVCIKMGFFKPESHRQKQGVCTITLSVPGRYLSEIEISYVDGINECVMYLKQGYWHRSYMHRINAAGNY